MKKIIMFAERFLRNAKRTEFLLCDGQTHYEVSEKDGNFTYHTAEHCDQQDCFRKGKEADPFRIPGTLQDSWNITAPAPGTQLIYAGDVNGKLTIVHSGDAVRPHLIRQLTAIEPGKSATIKVKRTGKQFNPKKPPKVWEERFSISNRKGKEVVLDQSSEERHRFREEQERKLLAMGLNANEVHAMLAMAGPGQVLAAIEYAKTCTPESQEKLREFVRNAERVSEPTFGWIRNEAARLGIEKLPNGSPMAVVRTLRGAYQALLYCLPALLYRSAAK